MCVFVCSVVSDSWQPFGLQPARLLCTWDFSGKDTGVGFHFLLQGIFPTLKLNLGLRHCRQILYQVSYKEATLNISMFKSGYGSSDFALVKQILAVTLGLSCLSRFSPQAVALLSQFPDGSKEKKC